MDDRSCLQQKMFNMSVRKENLFHIIFFNNILPLTVYDVVFHVTSVAPWHDIALHDSVYDDTLE